MRKTVRDGRLRDSHPLRLPRLPLRNVGTNSQQSLHFPNPAARNSACENAGIARGAFFTTANTALLIIEWATNATSSLTKCTFAGIFFHRRQRHTLHQCEGASAFNSRPSKCRGHRTSKAVDKPSASKGAIYYSSSANECIINGNRHGGNTTVSSLT